MRLLILAASLACARSGVLSDITVDLAPPLAQQSGYATTAGLGAVGAETANFAPATLNLAHGPADLAPGTENFAAPPAQYGSPLNIATSAGVSSSDASASAGWIGIPAQGPPTATIPRYAGSALGSLTTGAAHYQPQSQTAQLPQTGTGHKYTTVTFGNGLIGLGHSVDYAGLANSASGQVQSTEDFNSNTVSVSHHTHAVPIEVPQPYQVTVSRPVPVPVAVPSPVDVPRPVPIEVLQPVAVPVERPYPVIVTKPVPVPVAQPVYVKVPHSVHVPVARPNPVYVEKHVPVHHHQHQQFEKPHLDHHQHLEHHHYEKPNFEHHHFEQPHLEHHHFEKHHHAHDNSHHHGPSHHSTSILSGLTGGLSSKLHGSHGSGRFHHHGDGYGSSGGLEFDHKFTNGLSKHLGHGYHSSNLGNHHSAGHGGFHASSIGHANLGGYHSDKSHFHGYHYEKPKFAGFGDVKLGSGYASGYTNYNSLQQLPTFFGKEYNTKHTVDFKFPKYAESYGKYASYPSFGYGGSKGFSSGSNFSGGSSGFKPIPETISQQYDSHGGYKY